MEEVVRKTSLFFYSVFVVTILIVASGYFFAGEELPLKGEAAAAISSLYFLYVLAVVPLTFYLFNKQLKKWESIRNEEEKLSRYYKASSLRIFFISSGMMLGALIFSFLFKTQSILFCTGIATLSMFFCIPGKARIISELNLYDTADDPESSR
ncbi:MAG: hypothetical protein LBS07_05280 [Prevotellaceae bacterium]|jgi:hypothetical protein|nr:hypothetical protein [Prevotellaceae bacterium]